MPKQNQKVVGRSASRIADLEKDLIGETVDTTRVPETGRQNVKEGTPFQESADRSERAFQIRQGFRRRHPDSVLNQFKTVVGTTSDASSMFEQSLIYETERAEMPTEFRPKSDVLGLTTQLGVTATAEKNYSNAKNKLDRMFLVGV